MSKAKLIVICAMCSAVVFGCLALASLPGLKWIALILAVVASVATVIPLMLDIKNLGYTLITYFVGSVLGMFLGIANVVFVAPIVTFFMPATIVKVYGETVKVKAGVVDEKILEDPFGNGDDKKVVSVRVEGKPHLPLFVRYILYYVLLEASICLTGLCAYLFTRPVFETLVSNQWIWLVIGVVQLIVFPFDKLLSGCLLGTAKILKKAVKPQ